MPLYSDISSLIIQYSDYKMDTDKFIDGFVPLLMKADKSDLAASTLVTSVTGAYSEFVEELISEEEFRRKVKQLLPFFTSSPFTIEVLTTSSPAGLLNYNKQSWSGGSPLEESDQESNLVKFCPA